MAALIMKYLIILRGPPGVGKTTISRHIINRLGQNKAVLLSLDEVRTEKFDLNVQQALDKEYIVGELFFGNSHTTRPEEWLSKFNDYSKISFILQILFDVCYQRAKNRAEYENYTEEQYRVLFYGFKFLCSFNIFNEDGGVREFCIDARDDSSSIAHKIVEMTKYKRAHEYFTSI